MSVRKLFEHHGIDVLFCLFSAGIIFFMFRPLFNIYYSFEEWRLLGTVYVHGLLGAITLLSPLEILAGKGRVLTLLTSNLSYYFAPFSPIPFALTSYLGHFMNTVFLYFIVKKLSRSTFIPFVAGSLFLTGSVASQVFLWFGATYENIFSVFFSLLSILLYVSLPKKQSKHTFLLQVVSWVSALIAYYFKEVSLVLVIILPWTYWFFRRDERTSVRKTIQRHIPVFIVFACIGFLRLVTHYVIQGNPFFIQQEQPYVPRIVFHMIYYPLTTLAHFFIPYEFMVRLADVFFKLQYFNIPKVFSDVGIYVLKYFVLADSLSFIITSVLLLFIFFVVYPVKKYRPILYFALIIYFFQHLLLSLYDTIPKGKAYFDSRYYYVLLPSGAILFALIADSIKNICVKIFRSAFIAHVIVFICLAGFMYKQATVMRRDITGASIESLKMREVMNQFYTVRKSLPDKPIILFSGNSEYFGLPGQYIPMKVNPGYLLMVWYYSPENIPADLINESYLFTPGEGYRVVGKKAYGFFNKKESLLTLFKNNPELSLQQVVGFYYDGVTHKLSDNTEEVQAYLRESL